jgi:pyruvate dehydrogenase E2 component (dihydrolipoamide acetyltransferase)
MLKEIKLPEIADNIDTATVLTILVKNGDQVEKDQTILEMESDKATFELPSDFDGTVSEIKVSQGDEVKVGQVLMTIEVSEEGKEDPKAAEPSEKDQEKTEKEKEDKEEKSEKEEKPQEADIEKDQPQKEKVEEPEEEEKKPSQPSRERAPEREIAAAPSIRRLARELGVDIYQVEGTGPYDRITSEDVKSYAKSIIQRSGEKAAAPAEDYQMPDFSKYGDIDMKPMDSIRSRIAKNMVASWQNIPHVFHFDKADVTDLEAFRKRYAPKFEKQQAKLTMTAILLKMLSSALQEFPDFNASLDMKNNQVIYKKYYNIGVAVDTERGLLVPVIRDVDKKSLLSISLELGELAAKARNKKIMPDELQGGNIALSNLGGIGGTNFTPIIFRPNVAVLGVSRTTTEAVYVEGELKPRLILPLSLSYDHRLIDGAQAARFLRWLCEALENPFLTMMKGD